MFSQKRIVRSILMFLVVVGVVANISCISSSAYNETFSEKNEKIILIDPGHGGIDGGAESKNGTCEKGINLQISKKLKTYLKKKGFKVVMTREKDKGLHSDKGRIREKKNEDLTNRCKMKVSTNCDLFISIHLNMFSQSKYHGAQVWYAKEGESAEIAHIIQENLRRDLDKNNNRQEKCAKGAYKILRCNNTMPSVIVECGFLSNPEEEQKLKSNEYQEKIAFSLAKSIEEFFKTKNNK